MARFDEKPEATAGFDREKTKKQINVLGKFILK